MCRKIRCDGKSLPFCKIYLQLNTALKFRLKYRRTDKIYALTVI